MFCILECQNKKTVRESTDLSLLRLVYDHRVFVMLYSTDDKMTEVILYIFRAFFSADAKEHLKCRLFHVVFVMTVFVLLVSRNLL